MPVFEKTKRQKEAINLLTSLATNIMLYGGSRSGKTFILMYAVLCRAFICGESRHAILRSKFSHVKKSIWLDTLPKVVSLCFPNSGIKEKDYNKSDYYLTLPNGSEVWMGGLDDQQRVEKILGNEYSTIYFNETSQILYNPIEVALTRLAQKNKLTKKAYYDCNPPRKTHWSYPLFIQKLNPLDRKPLEVPDDYVSLLMNPEDNLENIDESYIKRLKSMSEEQRQRFLYGEFLDSSDGQAYYSFNRQRHVKKVTRQTGTVFIGMDFNVDPMTAVVFQYINNKFYIFAEVFLRNSDTYKMKDTLIRGGNIGRVIPDSTGANRKTSGISDHKILKDSGFVVEDTRNPFVTDRVNNMNRLFQDDRIIIDPSCGHLINDFEQVVWKDNKLDQKTQPLLTHISDALGYGAWWHSPLLDIPKQTIGRWA